MAKKPFFQKKPSPQEYTELLPDLPAEERRDQLDRLPDRYFLLFDRPTLTGYAEMLASLGNGRPFLYEVRDAVPPEVEVRVVAFDREALFSMVAGALSAGGMNIESGDIFTYLPDEQAGAEAGAGRGAGGQIAGARRRPPLSSRFRRAEKPKKVVDVFRGRVGAEEFSSKEESLEELRRILGEILRIFYGGKTGGSGETGGTGEKPGPGAAGGEEGARQAADLARERLAEELSRRLLVRRERGSAPKMYPIEMEVGSHADGSTRLHVRSQDTPFFLYAFGTVLALHRISIEHVEIKTDIQGIEDTFFVRKSSGEAITDEKQLRSIRLSILFTKQFTHFLWNAPDPYRALTRFETLVRDFPLIPEEGAAGSLVADSKVLRRLSRLLGASDFLWEDFIRLQYENIIPLLSKERITAGIDTSREGLERELRGLLEEAQDFEGKKRVLNEFKDRYTYLVDLEHIIAPDADFMFLSAGLSEIAELVVRTAFDLAWERLVVAHGTPMTVAGLPTEYAVTALGKFGGRALGYASDIELLVLYRDTGETSGPKKITNTEFFIHLVRTATLIIESKREGIYRVDLRLRPHGSGGPLAVSLAQFVSYFRDEASSLEKLALVRLRAICGSSDFGAQVERLRDTLIYEGGSIDVEELIRLRRIQAEKYSSAGNKASGGPNGKYGPNVKYDPGGLIDLEYTLQVLQVFEGAAARELRTPYLHEVFAYFSGRGILDGKTVERLEGGYFFLRRLINALRMLRGNALDLYLPERDAPEFSHLARRMGYRSEEGTGGVSAEEQLWIDFQKHTAVVRNFVERRLGAHAVVRAGTGNIADLLLGDAPGGADGVRGDRLAAGAQGEQLAAGAHETQEGSKDLEIQRLFSGAGFRDPRRAFLNIRNIHRLWPDSSKFLETALLAWDYLRRSPDPDMALNNWERFVTAYPKGEGHFEEVYHQPKRLEILLRICAASQYLADHLTGNPGFFTLVTDPMKIRVPMTYRDFYEELTAIRWGSTHEDQGRISSGQSEQAPDPEEWRRELRIFRHRHILRIGSRDICYGAPLEEITGELSSLAEAVVQGVLDFRLDEAAGSSGNPVLKPDALCILAFGKLGGGELNYSSDIDLVVLYDPDEKRISDDERKHLNRLVRRVRSDIADITENGMVYRVDFRLRPYGSSGELVFTPGQMEDYYHRAAALWEFQALLKARPIAGYKSMGRDLLEKIYTVVFSRLDQGEVINSVMRARRPPDRAADRGIDVKEDPGGIRDIEFLLQALQLIHAGEDRALISGNSLEALTLLTEQGLLDQGAAGQLREAYRFLRRVEHFLQLLEDRQEHHLPEDPHALEALGGRMRWTQAGSGNFSEHLHSTMAAVSSIFLTTLEKSGLNHTKM